jgi:hypothetical protein
MAGSSGGRSGGAPRGAGGSTRGATNDQIIPQDSHAEKVKNKGLLGAVSDIQQYYVLEREQDIPAEFLTISGALEYWFIGAKSGFNEGLLLFLFFPMMEFYLIPFVFKGMQADNTLAVVFHSMPYLMVMFNTILCVYVSKFYTGAMTRKVINSLFTGRAMALFLKGCLLYLMYYFLSKMGTPRNVANFAYKFFSNPTTAENFYYGFFQIHPRLLPAGTRAFIFVTIAAFGPYGIVYMRDVWRTFRIKRNLARVTGKMS